MESMDIVWVVSHVSRIPSRVLCVCIGRLQHGVQK